MKRYLFLFLFACCWILPTHGQTSALSSTLKEQMSLLKEAHAVKFVYDATVPLDYAYEGPSLQGRSLSESLTVLFHALPIEWTVRGKYVMLRNKKRFTVSGPDFIIASP